MKLLKILGMPVLLHSQSDSGKARSYREHCTANQEWGVFFGVLQLWYSTSEFFL